MNGAADAVTLHQLLGRIVYFHALVIEPVLRPGTPLAPAPVCCAHSPHPNPCARTVGELLPGSAWQVLWEIATPRAVPSKGCPTSCSSCCATCHVSAAAGTIAASWARTEYRTYRECEPAGALVDACASAASTRLGRVFAFQHSSPCSRLERTAPQALPPTEELPLTGELLALWANPTTVSRHPVVTWLNHCTSLDDVQRVLASKRRTIS